MQNPHPPLDRALLQRDLEALSRLIAASLVPWSARLPFPLNRVVSPAVLTRELSGLTSRFMASTDEELVPLVDALGRELGALRGALAPIDGAFIEAHPEVPAALAAVVGRLL